MLSQKVFKVLALAFLWAISSAGMIATPADDALWEKKIDEFTAIISSEPKRVSAYAERADAYDRLGQYQKAIDDLTKAISLSPESSYYYTKRADLYDKIGKHDLAKDDRLTSEKVNHATWKKSIDGWSKAIKNNPEDQDAYYGRGLAFHSLGEYTKAIDDFTKTLTLAESWALPHFFRGRSYAALGDYEQAIPDYSRAIDLDYGIWHSRLGGGGYLSMDCRARAEAYMALGKYQEAVNDYSKVADYQARAEAYMALGQYQLAVNDYRSVISNSPEDGAAYYERAQAYEKLGKHELATRDLENAKQRGFATSSWEHEKDINTWTRTISLEPKNVSAYARRAAAYAGLGQYHNAIHDFTNAISLVPTNSYYYTKRADLYDRVGKHDLAKDDRLTSEKVHEANAKEQIDAWSKAIHSNPNNRYAYYERGLAHHSLGEHTKAIDDFTKAITLDPKFNWGQALLFRGNSYAALADYEHAIPDYTRAIDLDSEDFYHGFGGAGYLLIDYRARAEAYMALGKYQEAVNDYSQVQDYQARAEAYMALGQYQPAVNDYSTVISNTPKYGAAYCGRARAYEKLGKQDLAEKDREKAKDLEYKPEQK